MKCFENRVLTLRVFNHIYMKNIKGAFAIEGLFILAGCVLHYFSHQTAEVLEMFGGLISMSIGAILIGCIPYVLLRSKIENPKIKVFSVAFFLVNLLVYASQNSI